MKYLLTTTETYRVSTEAEVNNLINSAKEDTHFVLSKYSSQYKERKQKGEVVDMYYKVTLVKTFTDEKEPEFSCQVTYTNGTEGAY